MESWVSKLGAAIGHPDVTVSRDDWLNMEKALQSWQSSVEEVLQNFCLQPENIIDEKNPDSM